MDRRYSQSRFYSGIRAKSQRGDRADALVRSYLGRARKANADNQSYGGATGGVKSTDNRGLDTLLARNVGTKEARQIFKDYGSGDLGARSALAEARGFRQPPSATTIAS